LAGFWNLKSLDKTKRLYMNYDVPDHSCVWRCIPTDNYPYFLCLPCDVSLGTENEEKCNNFFG
jgi:hypothetical protein